MLEVLVAGFQQDQDPHGWTIMKTTHRSGPTVYGVLERLEEWGWITGIWEELPDGEARPRRRYYRLTPTGRVEAASLLAERRPASSNGSVIRRFLPGGAS